MVFSGVPCPCPSATLHLAYHNAQYLGEYKPNDSTCDGCRPEAPRPARQRALVRVSLSSMRLGFVFQKTACNKLRPDKWLRPKYWSRDRRLRPLQFSSLGISVLDGGGPNIAVVVSFLPNEKRHA